VALQANHNRSDKHGGQVIHGRLLEVTARIIAAYNTLIACSTTTPASFVNHAGIVNNFIFFYSAQASRRSRISS
jgi:hypothetical protein